MPVCELCGRRVSKTQKHHLIPRTRHSNRRVRSMHSRDELHETVDLCRPCHKTIHANLGEKALQREYNTLEKIRTHPEISTFVEWIKDRPERGRISVRKAKR